MSTFDQSKTVTPTYGTWAVSRPIELTDEQRARMGEIAAELQEKLLRRLDQDYLDAITNTIEGKFVDQDEPETRQERRREKRARRVARGFGR